MFGAADVIANSAGIWCVILLVREGLDSIIIGPRGSLLVTIREKCPSALLLRFPLVPIIGAFVVTFAVSCPVAV